MVYYALRHEIDLHYFDFPTQANIERSVVSVSHLSEQTVEDDRDQLGLKLPTSAEFEEIETYETVSLHRFVRSDVDVLLK